MIRHTVVFKLKHSPGSAAEAEFLRAARDLARIPTVQNFEYLRQVSPKNDYTFGFMMEFADASSFQVYNNDPTHDAFVRNRWIPEVEKFLEIDYEPFSPD